MTPMGDRLRVTATAEFAGYDRSHKPADFAFMKRIAGELFPRGLAYDRAEMWAGLRPMTPDNLPVLGRRQMRNLWLNKIGRASCRERVCQSGEIRGVAGS